MSSASIRSEAVVKNLKMKIAFIILISLFVNERAIAQINKIDAPIENFESLWNEFDKRYANLELKKNGFSKPIKKRLSRLTNFQYRVSESFGYLRLDEMTEKRNFRKFKRAVDKSIKAFSQKQGLIIDLRFNGGGEDKNAYNLASRFIPNGAAIGHFMRTKIKGKEEYTEMEYKKVNSGGKNQFTNSIIILTSDFTASAAEVFLLLMKELPNVVIIGDKTEGIFSTMYEFTLPNQWEVSLSHEQFFSKSKENYEGQGITPNISVLNSKIDIEHQHDPVIEMAINYLKKRKNQ